MSGSNCQLARGGVRAVSSAWGSKTARSSWRRPTPNLWRLDQMLLEPGLSRSTALEGFRGGEKSLRGAQTRRARGELGFEGPGVLDPHEGTVTRTKQEPRRDEYVKQCRARRHIQAPEPTRLRFRQAQARHLEKFPLHAAQSVHCHRRFVHIRGWRVGLMRHGGVSR